jgi:endoglucanase Acf2
MKTFTVSARDNTGNNATPQSVNYLVSYGVRVLFDQTKAAKSGSTIPIKIQLVDANGNNLSTSAVVVHAVSVVQTSSSASILLDDAGQANPDFDFRYDSSLGGYIFNLKTTGYGTGTYVLTYTVQGDPVTHTVQFQVRQ